ncbi:hypothetical protein ZIOFF_018512 [Zingiber officinale]|uniref:Uncharacterized protein n=1 Tax=Zingiber officinale TaxID=94328 RepID=A0A8J5HD10_ZINOF|nr:hypothetical protein ZIOFF_018512 [Zingiber officinale]
MQVTRSNFNAALEGLRACVEESDFVAVDLEMTGVTSAPWRDSFEFDRSNVRYLKLKDSAKKFAVVQFGVCPLPLGFIQGLLLRPSDYSFDIFGLSYQSYLLVLWDKSRQTLVALYIADITSISFHGMSCHFMGHLMISYGK